MLFLAGYGSSSKEIIIQILSEEWPLSSKQIHSKIRRYGKSVSYQAVHKTLKELIKNNVLKRSDSKKYKINLTWVYRLENTCSNIAANYSSKTVLPIESSCFENLCLTQLHPSTVLAQQIS